LQGASFNVFINTSSMKDVDRAASYNKEAKTLLNEVGTIADTLYDYVMKEIQ